MGQDEAKEKNRVIFSRVVRKYEIIPIDRRINNPIIIAVDFFEFINIFLIFICYCMHKHVFLSVQSGFLHSRVFPTETQTRSG